MREMDVLWSKERLHKIFSKDSIGLSVPNAFGDGDSPMRCCRLCGGDGNLKCFCETYLWEGVEERYDQLLYNCFGIRVLPTDGMICERCIRQLRMTQSFRALVQSAFAEPPSEFSVTQSQMGIGEGLARPKIKNNPKQSKIELLKKGTRTLMSTTNPKKYSERSKTTIINNNIPIRRMNIACTMCKQKYPMIMPFEGYKKFVCSRCKKKGESRSSFCRKCNMIMPNNMLRDHLELHARTALRGKCKLCSVQKKPSQMVKMQNFEKTKYQCNLCTKKYSLAQHLSQHVANCHKNTDATKYIDTVCAVCGKDMNTREMLERHMRMHTGQPIYQCDVCMRFFKGKRSFQTHYLTHGK